jgi:peroxiredoxin
MKVFSLLGAMSALTLAAPAVAQTPPTTALTHILGPGDKAPDFTLLSNDWKEVKLSDFHGKKNVVVVFYVLAFTDT